MTLPKLLSFFRGVQKIAVLCTLLAFCFSTTSCSQSYTLPNLTVLPLQETYRQAANIALDWQADAQLNSIDFDIEFSSSPERMRASYTFLSAAKHEFLLVFVKTDESGYYLETVEDSWPADRPIGIPIIFEEINLESKEALQAIMENGGSIFFERYQLRKKVFADYFNLSLERLDDYNGEGPLIWTSGFAIDSPHAQLYMSIEDTTGDLLKVRAYGEQEQEYWLRDITVTERILTGDAKNFFDLFDLRLDAITKENGRRYADITIISPKSPVLIRGQVTHTHINQGSMFYFDNYEITLVKIDQEGIDVDVMPIDRWYKPRPTD